jgi:5-methylcytosine-specific restriction protein A
MSPTAPRSPCTTWPCPNYAEPGGSKCAAHRKEATAQWEAQTHRGSSAARGYGRQWQKTRLEFLQAHPQCGEPGCSAAATEAHHKHRRRDGGSDHPDNLEGLCRRRHNQRTGRERALDNQRGPGTSARSGRTPTGERDAGPRLY